MPAQQLRSVAALLLLSASASLGAEIITLHKYDSASARCGEVGVDVADVPNAKKDEPELMEIVCGLLNPSGINACVSTCKQFWKKPRRNELRRIATRKMKLQLDKCVREVQISRLGGDEAERQHVQ